MGNLKEEKLRKLKRSYTGGAMVAFFVIGVIILVTFSAMLFLFGLYVTDSKLRDEYRRIQSMSEAYMITEQTGDEAVFALFDGPDSAYFITDNNGDIIETKGENTCDLSSGGMMSMPGIDASFEQDDEDEDPDHIVIKGTDEGSFMVYPDTNVSIITPSAKGGVLVDYVKIFRIFYDYGRSSTDYFDEQEGMIKLPVWIEVPMTADRNIVCRSFFRINYRDLLILFVLAVCIVVQTIVMLVFMIIFFCSNIRKRKRMTEVFFMDEVTGKHNWLWFLTNAERELKKKQSASNKYAVLDIVFVNYRNFCVCHSVSEGEEMLRSVYDTIAKHLSRKELVAHHSAAHFAAMLIYSDRDGLEERIRAITDDLERINEDHKFSFWVGVDRIKESTDEKGRHIPRRNIDIEKEYNNAGAARATITGDDTTIVFFDEKMVEEQKWIDTINENQEKALENEEFVVYYQPKYDPRTNELRGAEALIRWMSPEHGMISPGRFIPQFERNGFITRIDHYMLSHVARDQKMWLDSGYKCVPVSVNVSRAHFIESDLADQIKNIVDEAGVPHELIEIELTESAFFDDKNAMISTIKILKDYGFTVSMDDFGSGYSSLNSLKEMPLDVLKLDADFFRNDDGEGRGQIVVSEAIRLAKNLKMRTVAEGVEEKSQVDFLAGQGCDMIQGFYFAKPMPKDEFIGRMSAND